MQKSRKVALNFALIFSAFVILIGFIPLLFYASLAVKYAELSQKSEILEYSHVLKHKFYSLKSDTINFIYPRSLIFRSAILDEQGEVLFSLLDSPPHLQDGEFLHTEGKLFYRSALDENVLGARHLIISKEFSYSLIFFDLFLLTSLVILLIFLCSFWIIRRSIEPFERANTRMNTFFKDVMHELRTPLGIMSLNIELLEEYFGNHRGFERTKAALKVLSHVYEDIEYFIKNKRMQHGASNSNISVILEDRLDYFSVIAKVKEITITSKIIKGIWVEIHPLELQRLIDNTLSNALKYSLPKKNITVSLSVEEGFLCFACEDEGIGIKNPKLIFERYYRGDDIQGGFGIGLNIVKSICAKHKISIIVESEPKKGSKFIYKFRKFVQIS